jgi:hypothetical protein
LNEKVEERRRCSWIERQSGKRVTEFQLRSVGVVHENEMVALRRGKTDCHATRLRICLATTDPTRLVHMFKTLIPLHNLPFDFLWEGKAKKKKRHQVRKNKFTQERQRAPQDKENEAERKDRINYSHRPMNV